MELADADTKAAMLSRKITIHAAFVLLEEAGGDEADNSDTKPAPQLPSSTSEQTSPRPAQPSSIGGELKHDSIPTDAVAPTGEEASEGAASSTSGGSSTLRPEVHHAPTGEGTPSQAPGSDCWSPPKGAGANGLDGRGSEQKPVGRTRAKATRTRASSPDRRSFERGMAAAEGYVRALLQSDPAEALAARDDGIERLIAAASGAEDEAGALHSSVNDEEGPEETTLADPLDTEVEQLVGRSRPRRI